MGFEECHQIGTGIQRASDIGSSLIESKDIKDKFVYDWSVEYKPARIAGG